MGNSFYRQVDYYSTQDCSLDPSQTLAQGRVYAEIAAGWFSITQATAQSYGQINMLAAPNFGNSYDLNIYQVTGTGQSGILMMGENTIDSTQRPTTLSVQYQYWNTATFGN
jgi:hypothetical protein